jgi:hypothetical protein
METMTALAMVPVASSSQPPQPQRDQLPFARLLVSFSPLKALYLSSGICPFPRTFRFVLSVTATHMATLQTRISNWLVLFSTMPVPLSASISGNAQSSPGPTTLQPSFGPAKAQSPPPTQPLRCYANSPTTVDTTDTSLSHYLPGDLNNAADDASRL